MSYPVQRPRRLRRFPALRDLVRETQLSVQDLILPLFVCEGTGVRQAIEAMPGNDRMSPDVLAEECRRIQDMGIPGIILFGIPDTKDEIGSSGIHPDGVIQKALRACKKAAPDLLLMTDVCLCEYTSHGHCGLLEDGVVDNDRTLERLVAMAISHVEAGADVVAPSDMMDGRVGAIRHGLDATGFSQVAIVAYSAKYASGYYGPFREAAGSTPAFGDRSTYQMDPANSREALREIALDVEEGADVIMVKPALAYMDIIYQARQNFDLPVAAYNVSGEFSMIKAAAERGWIDEKRVVLETLLSMKRAGADMILTYSAKDVAGWLAE